MKAARTGARSACTQTHMSPLLDSRTLVLVITIVLICRAAILLYVWFVAGRYPPVRLWATGSSIIAGGVLLLGLRGFAPDFLTIVIAQALTMTGWLVIDAGTVLAAGRRPPWKSASAVLVVAVALVGWYAVVQPDFAMRTIAVTVATVAFDLYTAHACLRFDRGSRRTTFRILAALLFILSASAIVKSHAYVESGSADMFHGGWAISQFYVLSLVSIVVGTVVFVLLSAQQMQEDLDLELAAHQRDKEAIARSEAKYHRLFDATSDAVMMLGRDRFTGCNRAALAMFGCRTEEEFCSYTPAALSPPLQPDGTDSTAMAKAHIDKAVREGHHGFEWVHRRVDSAALFTAEVKLDTVTIDGEKILQATARDISERKRMEEDIRQLAFFDTLTGLPNRRLLVDRLTMAMASSRRTGYHGALLFLDLDNFKALNDAHGHHVGDLLLCEVASRLRGSVREMDTVARFGGDEFVILVGQLQVDSAASRHTAESVAQKILTLLSLPYVLATQRADVGQLDIEHRCSVSIGVTLFRGHDVGREELMRRADSAMYAAKRAGRRGVSFFEA